MRLKYFGKNFIPVETQFSNSSSKNMICPSTPIPAETELTDFCMFLVAKNTAPHFGAPLLAFGGICLSPAPLPAATVFMPTCILSTFLSTSGYHLEVNHCWEKNSNK